jgi:hypothetical protein
VSAVSIDDAREKKYQCLRQSARESKEKESATAHHTADAYMGE